ncbi:hypothetical protein VMUT_0671 [Vulcanisaeta moutnovskia 768-28]|uniref:Uncharacterized protein n=1 Tax=Vulcanisaeta moutnovskia (strain 768-28) TaxID=985053 RepID=F0QVM9_VULM7|nr:hypothetical protein [Vulcanisaeta moutnovskia]ADY00882.1 hypothetical protein VMUT_0671 [Vulcanisaeta moutnovskia 768-28]
MNMKTASRKWLVATASIVVAAVVLGLVLSIHVIHRPLVRVVNTNGQEGPVTVNTPAPVSINVPIYVVGLATLVQKLINAGINQSLIKPVTINELPSLPSNSLVIIDWSVLGPSLVVNKSGVVFVNTNSTVFGLIVLLIERGDFLIIHGNASDVLLIERALALAWSRAYNTSIVAMPVPKYLNGLNYVVAYGNEKALIIGPHTLSSALETTNNLWTPIITKQPSIDPSDDVCEQVIQEYGVPANQPAQVNNAYVIVYGEQTYSDSYGLATVDFCVSWAGIVDTQYNGYSIGYAELYNYIYYEPNSGTYINYLKSFQDAYASYMVYEYENGEISASQLPLDVTYIAGSGGGYYPGYWTSTAGFSPHAQQCSVSGSYTVSFATGFSISATGPSGGITVSNSITQGYSCPQVTLNVVGDGSNSTPIGGAVNTTWIYQPTTTNTDINDLATESEGNTYMGPAYNPQPSAYTIPAGASVDVSVGGCDLIGTEHEHIVYDINWDVWVNSNGAMSSYSNGAYIPPPAYYYNENSWTTNNGFYTTQYCT